MEEKDLFEVLSALSDTGVQALSGKLNGLIENCREEVRRVAQGSSKQRRPDRSRVTLPIKPVSSGDAFC